MSIAPARRPMRRAFRGDAPQAPFADYLTAIPRQAQRREERLRLKRQWPGSATAAARRHRAARLA